MGPRSAISQASSKSSCALSGPVRAPVRNAQPGAGEEAAGKLVLLAGAAEAGHGGVQFAARFEVGMIAARAVRDGSARRAIRESPRRARRGPA